MHTIRLRRPWHRTIGDQTARVDVPDMGQDRNDPKEVVRYGRTFHRPTNLEPGQSVTLTIGGWEGRLSQLRLNGIPIETDKSFIEAEITGLLERSNRIELELAADSNGPARLSGEVALNIRDAPHQDDART